jgi:hypothetical protein
MEAGWTKIYTTDKPYQADMLVELLEENDIAGVSVNKKDSSYLAFGEDEVYVKDEDVEKAEIIKNNSGL